MNLVEMNTQFLLRVGKYKIYQEYPLDVNARSFADEMVQFASFARAKNFDTAICQSLLIHNEGLRVSFPNVCVVLRMYLSWMSTNCTGKRSFSKLVIITNRLLTTMSDGRLIALGIMIIESDILRKISFEDVIAEFAEKKSRKCQL